MGVDGGASGRDGAVVGVDGAVPGSDGSVPGTDSGGGSADAGPPLAFCQIGCTAAADCTSGSAAFDADNYRCEAGVCRYTGCNSDAECEASFSSTAYTCATIEGGQRTCVMRCSVAADCGSSGAFDGDNYRCDVGHCVYTGCNTDAECQASFSSIAYVCRDVLPPDTGLPLPTARRNCVLGCATMADCSTASAAFDADNYRCEAGACRYEGCNDDAECASSFMSSRYVCR
jgi:hypothetical protein